MGEVPHKSHGITDQDINPLLRGPFARTRVQGGAILRRGPEGSIQVES